MLRKVEITRTETSLGDILHRARRTFLWAGILLCLLGAAALAMPYFSSLLVAMLIGALLITGGALTFLAILPIRSKAPFLWLAMNSLLSVAAGIYLLFFPTGGLLALTFLVATIILLTGIAQFVIAWELRPGSTWNWMLVSALVSVCLGILIIAVLPEASTVLLGVLIGIDFFTTGTALIALSLAATIRS